MNRYSIRRFLGKGGIGETFLVEDRERDGHLFALKRVEGKALASKVASLRHEFATLKRLAHPNIARVVEFGESGESCFFVEEYIDGPDVFEALHGADYNRVLAAFVQILRALQYLHGEGFLHGDLKPENILTVRGASLLKGGSVKLIDFGLARHLAEGGARGRPAGSLHFMAPEILLEKPYDHRADFYALGVSLYRMITGRYPFENDRNRVDLLVRDQIEKTPVAPQRFRTDLPKGLNDLTLRLLSKNPEGRFERASDILRALNALEGERFALWTQDEARVALKDGPIEPDPPWDRAAVVAFLKKRLRLASIPSRWEGALVDLTSGDPQKAIALADFWLREGIVRLVEDRAEFVRDAGPEESDLNRILEKTLDRLEADKRSLLKLCAYGRVPMSPDVLEKMVDWPRDRVADLVRDMEKEGWLSRVLVNGTYHYRVDAETADRLLESGRPLGRESLEGLLTLADATYRAGRLREARRVVVALAPVYEKAAGRSREERVRYWTVASLVAIEEGDLERARALCREFLQTPSLSDEESGKAWGRLGWIDYRRGAYDEALQSLQKAEAFWDRTGDIAGRGAIANLQGMTHEARGDWPAAREAYRRALAIVPEEQPFHAIVRMNLGVAAQLFEDYALALESYGAAEASSRGSANLQFRARLLNNLANLNLFLGRLDEAERAAHASLTIAVENGLAGLEGHDYLLLSVVADREGRWDACREFLEKSEGVFEAHGTSAERATARLHRAYYEYTVGEDAKALETLARLQGDFPGERRLVFQSKLLAAKIAARHPYLEDARAVSLARETIDYFRETRDQSHLWDAYRILARLLRRENPREARDCLQRALEIVERLAEKIPSAFREGFFRDRKRERLLAELTALGPPGGDHEDVVRQETGETKEKTVERKGEIQMTQRNQQGAYSEIARINRLLASEHNLTYLLETILDESLEMLEAERGFVLLLEEGRFRVKASRNLDRQALEEEQSAIGRYSSTIARQAATSKGSILVADAQSDDRFMDAASVVELNIRAALAVPMRIGPEVVGVVYVDNRFHSGRFDEDHQKLLEHFADQAALALRNARQTEEIRSRSRELEASRRRIEELNGLLKERLDLTEKELTMIQERYQVQQTELQLRYAYDQIVGKSPRLLEVLKTLDRVTDSDVTVLIQGESGTGKELIARALHYNGPRKGAPFVAENCAAFSEQLLESELFGHKKGSFTGATANKQGLFEVADGGTIFLDEIGDMSPGMQAKLLRVLQDRLIRPIGGNDYRKVNVRVVAATHRDLKAMVKEKTFREDLYYRINVVKVTAPPLRDRKDDIPMLVDHFLKKHEEEAGGKIKVHPKAMALLMRYDWPGNIRELGNEIARCAAMGLKMIGPESLSEKVREEFTLGPKTVTLDSQVESLEKNVIVETLKKYHYSRLKTAKALGVSRITLYKKMKSYGILAKKSDYSRVNA